MEIGIVAEGHTRLSFQFNYLSVVESKSMLPGQSEFLRLYKCLESAKMYAIGL